MYETVQAPMMDAVAGGNAPPSESLAINPFKTMLQGGTATGLLVSVRTPAVSLPLQLSNSHFLFAAMGIGFFFKIYCAKSCRWIRREPICGVWPRCRRRFQPFRCAGCGRFRRRTDARHKWPCEVCRRVPTLVVFLTWFHQHARDESPNAANDAKYHVKSCNGRNGSQFKPSDARDVRCESANAADDAKPAVSSGCFLLLHTYVCYELNISIY
jgi:hypothetical protein